MTIGNLYGLYNGIKSCDDIANNNAHFAVKLALAFDTIEPILKAAEKAKPKSSKEFTTYNKRLQDLLLVYSTQQEDGKLKTENGGIIISDVKGYNKTIRELEKEFGLAIEEEELNKEKWNEILDSDVSEYTGKGLTLPVIKRSELPKDILVKQLRGIVLLLEKE